MSTLALHLSSRRPGRAGVPRWRGHQVAPPLMAVLAVLAVLAVTITWWRDSPPIGSDAGSQLTAAGRLFGLYSALLAGTAVLLMARVPWLDRAVGSDRLARLHAVAGRSVVGTATVHLLFIVWGYAATAGVGPLRQVRTLWHSYPHVLMASFGFGLLLMVGATSARAARARMSYEYWRLAHLGTYTAIALIFLHPLSNGVDFVGHPLHQRLWRAWFISVAVILVSFRVALPTVRALRHRTTVDTVVPETADVVSIRITGRRMEKFGGQAGQFVRVRFLTPGRWWQSHPYSLSTAPDPGSVRVSVKAAGDHTRGLGRLRPGTRVVLNGPYGGLLASRRTREGVLLIAAGIGITPLRSLFETLPADGDRLILIYRAGNLAEAALRDELDELARTRGGRVHYLTGPRSSDRAADPLGPDALHALVPDIAERDVFLCGPPAVMIRLTHTVRKLGVPKRAIHQERFTF